MNDRRRALNELAGVYRDADAAIAALANPCRSCGRCCDFTTYGHRLFCSSLEAYALLQGVPERATLTPAAEIPRARDRITPGTGWLTGPDCACRFLAGERCSVYPARTLACRTFLCSPAVSEASRTIHEIHLARIKDLCRRRGFPWLYGPLDQVLEAVLEDVCP